MYLNVVPSTCCSLHQIRLPERLRNELNLDLGDELVFNTPLGDYALKVYKAMLDDMIEHGEGVAYISEHSPVLDAKSSEVYIEPHELTIGCDPELFLISRKSGKVVPAWKLLPKERKFGSDGDLAELRPDHGLGPAQLIVNLRRLIATIPFDIPLWLDPYACSWHAYRCSGFHIHLGMPMEILSFAADGTDLLVKSIITTLDYFVGVPAACLDPEDKRRFNKEYGKPGDYRLKMRTLEYRTPGGFHLKSPAYAKSLLNSAYYITQKIIRDTEIDSKGWTETKEITDYNYFRSKYCLPNKSYVKDILKTKNREKLKDERDKVVNKLGSIIKNSNFIVKERHEDEQHLFREWLGDET